MKLTAKKKIEFLGRPKYSFIKIHKSLRRQIIRSFGEFGKFSLLKKIIRQMFHSFLVISFYEFIINATMCGKFEYKFILPNFLVLRF